MEGGSAFLSAKNCQGQLQTPQSVLVDGYEIGQNVHTINVAFKRERERERERERRKFTSLKVPRELPLVLVKVGW
jgi:hypothetical protein